jgi:hypothetical protein
MNELLDAIAQRDFARPIRRCGALLRLARARVLIRDGLDGMPELTELAGYLVDNGARLG